MLWCVFTDILKLNGFKVCSRRYRYYCRSGLGWTFVLDGFLSFAVSILPSRWVRRIESCSDGPGTALWLRLDLVYGRTVVKVCCCHLCSVEKEQKPREEMPRKESVINITSEL